MARVRLKKHMHLAFDASWTEVEVAWRDPASWVDRHYPSVGHFQEIARVAERGGLDMIFFGDGTGIPTTWTDGIEDAVRWGVAWPRIDMSPWITVMSQVTSHVGFGLTYASTFMHPFYVARLLNSLDHVTNGRVAFNVITSQRRSDYENYGLTSWSSTTRGMSGSKSLSTSAERCGTASSRTPFCGTAPAVSSPTLKRCTRSATPVSSLRCAGR